MYLVFLTDRQTSQLCPNAWVCFPMHQEEMERLIALQLWLHQQWIGDDRWDVGFGIHMISEIPCACWWAWQCFFSSFYTQIFPLLVYLKTDKDNYYTCMCTFLLFEKNPQIFPALFPLLPPTIDQPSPPWGNTLHAEGMHCVGAGKCSGVTPGGRQQLSQNSTAVALGWGQSAKKEQKDNSSVSGC